MSTTIRTMPTVGERAVIIQYEGHRTPATYVEQCDVTHAPWVTGNHWCHDAPTSDGFTWTSRPDVAREPMSTDTPRPERVTLSAEEREALGVALFNATSGDYGGEFAHPLAVEVERILAAREQALRDEIAGERDAYLDSPALDPAWIAGWHSAVDHIAARIARGEAR